MCRICSMILYLCPVISSPNGGVGVLGQEIIMPLFLQRCLQYKVRAKHCRRIQMSISLSETLNDQLQIQSLFPVHIMLARMLSDVPDTEHSAVYQYTKARALATHSTEEGAHVARTTFILPEMNKLVKGANSESLFILFISYGGANASCEFDTSREHVDNISFSSNIEKTCLWGKISLESLFLSWEKFPNLNKGVRCELLSTVDLVPSILKTSLLGVENCISLRVPNNASSMSVLQQVQVIISAEEQGAKESSAYNPCTYNNVPASSSHVLRLRTGNVIFNYRYYHNRLQRTEVTEDFSCPFCLVKCASFKGLKLHLLSSHDLFHFEFWVTDEYQAVNVSVKTDLWRPEVLTPSN
uniref:Polycomb protein VEFS-Box domain-containing protein n=1 Tax=Opuntia streptacantha TaxID=393608 RepID=A0A7C9B7K0_OPUST